MPCVGADTNPKQSPRTLVLKAAKYNLPHLQETLKENGRGMT
jgi:hypothetical protein